MYDAGGVMGLMMKAVLGARAPEYTFSFNGDLNCMGIQAQFLKLKGFDIAFNDVYPCVKTEDEFKRAIKLIFDNDVEGWWNYREKILKYGICDEQTWQQKIEAYSAVRAAKSRD